LEQVQVFVSVCYKFYSTTILSQNTTFGGHFSYSKLISFFIGGALFSWVQDAKLLLYGPFEFRVVKNEKLEVEVI